jgi:hypothetical protein
MTGRILPRMPSYAHYSQTLILDMPVPLESIHLHKHSPSVLHLPLWVSATGQIGKSQSPKLVLDTLWKKPLPNKLAHLERELFTGLTTCLFQQQSPPSPGERLHTEAKHELTLASKPHAVQHCVATTTNWENRHMLPKQAPQPRGRLTLWFSGTRDTHSTQGMNTDSMVQNRGCTGLSETNTRFP